MFSGGILGILMNNKNLILLLIYIELILLAVNTNFIIFSKLWNDINGQIFVLFVLTISAAEIAVALAIIFKLFQTSQTINITDLSSLRQ